MNIQSRAGETRLYAFSPAAVTSRPWCRSSRLPQDPAGGDSSEVSKTERTGRGASGALGKAAQESPRPEHLPRLRAKQRRVQHLDSGGARSPSLLCRVAALVEKMPLWPPPSATPVLFLNCCNVCAQVQVTVSLDHFHLIAFPLQRQRSVHAL